MRGKGEFVPLHHWVVGITPAYAGKSGKVSSKGAG